MWANVRRLARGHRRFIATIVSLISVLVAVNLLRIFGPVGTGLVIGPVAALGLVLFARGSGLTWHDLGLSRRTWVKGGAYAAGAVVVVASVYAIAAMLPLTRTAFLDPRYAMAPGSALLTALVIIPLGTVLLEEVAFRGVLLGFVTRHAGVRWGLGLSSVLFGAWHILPSMGLAGGHPAVAGIVGGGDGATVIVVLAVVTFTALAGWLLGELRRRSGSLLAAAGLHWAVNGIGVLVATMIYASGVG